jgi:hypothetical protein
MPEEITLDAYSMQENVHQFKIAGDREDGRTQPNLVPKI